MSIYHSYKCSSEELTEWKKQVFSYLKENGLDPKKLKMRFQRYYDGTVSIYLYKQTFENSRTSIRKSEESSTGYYKGLFSKEMWMCVYFYRSEWMDYLKDADNKKYDLEQIKKYPVDKLLDRWDTK